MTIEVDLLTKGVLEYHVVESALTKLIECNGRRVVGLPPDVTVKQAALEMRRQRIGALLIMRDEDHLVGILTERDILNKVVAEGRDPEKVKVREVMTKDVVVIDPSRTVRDAMNIVTSKRLRHLPVVRDGHLMGMVSGGDLTRSIVAEEEEVIDTLYEYIRGAYPA